MPVLAAITPNVMPADCVEDMSAVAVLLQAAALNDNGHRHGKDGGHGSCCIGIFCSTRTRLAQAAFALILMWVRSCWIFAPF